ncbi:MAG TPA: hypothetical protein VKE98_09260 [Gemmataceae bacterium]|nr:hypothetical protein [Gemmataceae bacterium]
MMAFRSIFLLLPVLAVQQAPPALPDSTLKGLSDALRGLLVQSLPETLYESSPNWGHTRQAANQLKWKGVRPKIYKTAKNDGVWRKLRLSTRNLANTMVVDLKDWKYPDTDHMTFSTYLAFDAGVEFEQQNWESGLRLYSGSLRARMRIHLNLQCEVLLKTTPSKTFIPDIVFRMRVLKSDLRYDNLVVEHVAGIGGSGAKVIGDALQSHMKQWHPSMERDLLAKANAAIVKAADTREVRLSLDALLKAKK